MAAIVSQATPVRLWGKYRYRVFRMAGDRVEAQAASKAQGLPDVVPVTQWPGVAGAFAELTMGSEVLIEFIEGDPAQPIVTAFAPKGDPGWVPVSLSLCDGQSPVARVGDMVTVILPTGMTFLATISGTPTPCTVITSQTAVGVIGGGSPKVKA
jgi:hypothetical protein